MQKTKEMHNTEEITSRKSSNLHRISRKKEKKLERKALRKKAEDICTLSNILMKAERRISPLSIMSASERRISLSSISLRMIFTSFLIVVLTLTVVFFTIHLRPSCCSFFVQPTGDKNLGEAYHSFEVFQKNYEEMEKKFKIFVYPDGDEKTYYHTPRSISGKYASEGYFFKNIRENSSFVTENPDEADLFFIPISCHKMHQKVSTFEDMAQIVEGYVEGLMQKYPYWNRTLGADHFFVTCHEIDVEATELVPHLVKNSIRVVCSATSDSGFIPHKDVSLPLVMQPFSKPAGRDVENRTILGYWAGNCNTDVRLMLMAVWKNDDELDINKQAIEKDRRVKKFYRAKFCICPRGLRPTSSRITMAIHYGCVPVIVLDNFELPFNDILDWRKFSVTVKEDDVFDLKRILMDKSDAEFRMLHRNLLEVQKHFQWNSPPIKYDAFHMILYELWLRRNTVRY